MRYYVLVHDEKGLIPPYIAGEVVRERYDDGEFRDSSLGASLGVKSAEILTREEIERDPDFRRALDEWEGQDDSAFDEHVDRAPEDVASQSPLPDETEAEDHALAHQRELERRAADALVAVRRRGMKIVKHRLALTESSELPPPKLTLHTEDDEEDTGA